MSKIGKAPVKIPQGVTVEISEGEVRVTGPKGALVRRIHPTTDVKVENGQIIVTSTAKDKIGHSIYGTTRALIANMVNGVSVGWTKELELVGTGFKAEVVGRDLVLTVGYSHPVKIEAPELVSFKVEKTIISVSGPDREVVGQIAADIRKVRPPEPYKGKGIKYRDEVIRRKPGKAAKAVGAPA